MTSSLRLLDETSVSFREQRLEVVSEQPREHSYTANSHGTLIRSALCDTVVTPLRCSLVLLAIRIGHSTSAVQIALIIKVTKYLLPKIVIRF